MAKYLFGQWKTQRHQKNGPVNGMETDDVFSDQVQICRPQLVKLLTAFAVAVIANTGDVVGQRIQPYIGHMFGIKGQPEFPR